MPSHGKHEGGEGGLRTVLRSRNVLLFEELALPRLAGLGQHLSDRIAYSSLSRVRLREVGFGDGHAALRRTRKAIQNIVEKRGPATEDLIHLWHISLACCDGAAWLIQLLSRDEQARMGRFLRDEHRNRYAVGRGWLRTIVGSYLDTASGRLEFVYGPHGKPAIGGVLADAPLRFSCSASGSVALIAITNRRAIGIDVELIDPSRDCTQIARSILSAEERSEYEQVCNEQRLRTLYKLWSRKEAYFKATGRGLTARSDEFTVGLQRCEAVLGTSVQSSSQQQWHISDVDCGDEYASSVCVVDDE